MTSKTKYFIAGLIILIVVAGGSFYAGIVYQRIHGALPRAFSRTGTRPFMARFPRQGLRPNGVGMGNQQISGKVLSISNNQLELQLPNGVVRTLAISPSTTYTKSGQSASEKDIVVGETVIATGPIQNGAPSGQSVQIIPGV